MLAILLAMLGRPRTDAPKTNRDPAEVERKLTLLDEPHIAPLTEFVARLRTAKPDAYVPYFDPTEAGVAARILILLEAPGRRSALEGGSNFVSPDNDDETAKNMWELLRDAGIDRGRDIVTWNVVPWYIGDGTKIRPTRSSDLDEARQATMDLLALVPSVRVVVLLGQAASRAWKKLVVGLPVLEASHPSPLNLNTRPENRDRLRETLAHALAVAGSP